MSKTNRCRRTSSFLALCGAALVLASCSGSPSLSGQHHTSSTTRGTAGTTVPAVNAPMRVKIGTGAIGPANPTTTLPNEGGHAIAPVIAAGQNIIIGPTGCVPQELEASVTAPVVWYNLSGKPARVIFGNSVDSGTIPVGGTFTWTEEFAVALAYRLAPSGKICKLTMNQPNP
jgi:hypothetical protein